MLFTVELAATTFTPSNSHVSPAAHVIAIVTVNCSYTPALAIQGKKSKSPAYNLPTSVKAVVVKSVAS